MTNNQRAADRYRDALVRIARMGITAGYERNYVNPDAMDIVHEALGLPDPFTHPDDWTAEQRSILETP